MTTPTNDSDRDANVTAEASTPVASESRMVVTFYVRQRWLKAASSIPTFDPSASEPPLTMVDAPLDSSIWTRGKAGTGPFERVLLRRPEE